MPSKQASRQQVVSKHSKHKCNPNGHDTTYVAATPNICWTNFRRSCFVSFRFVSCSFEQNLFKGNYRFVSLLHALFPLFSLTILLCVFSLVGLCDTALDMCCIRYLCALALSLPFCIVFCLIFPFILYPDLWMYCVFASMFFLHHLFASAAFCFHAISYSNRWVNEAFVFGERIFNFIMMTKKEKEELKQRGLRFEFVLCTKFKSVLKGDVAEKIVNYSHGNNVIGNAE